MPGTLICYGDSNTYGYDPHDTNEGRYPKEVRWTGILDTETDWKVENHGVNGRSIPHTVSTVKFACQQVRDWHRKPNSVWLLVMLGTNDLLENPDFTAADVAKRMERFLKRMMEEAGLASRKMRLRLIAPPAMQEGQWVDRPELLTESRNLGKEYKRIAKRPSRHSYRALDNLHILFPCIYIRLFIPFIGIAFLCRHKPACDLHTICPKCHSMINIFPVKNSASNYHWNFPAKLFLIFLFTCNNIPDFLVKIHLIPVSQLIPGKSQVSSCLRSFHYDQICSPVISMCPHFQNQICCPF